MVERDKEAEWESPSLSRTYSQTLQSVSDEETAFPPGKKTPNNVNQWKRGILKTENMISERWLILFDCFHALQCQVQNC